MLIIKILTIFILTLVISKNNIAYELIDNRVIFNESEAVDYYLTELNFPHYSKSEKPKVFSLVQKVSNELLLSFNDTLKSNYSKLPPTPIILLTNKDGGSAAMGISLNGETYNSNVIKIDTSQTTIEHLRPILAHEIAHYYLSHSQRHEAEEAITSVYSEEVNCISCNEVWNTNQEIVSKVGDLLSDIDTIGTLFFIDTQNIPISLFRNDGELPEILEDMLKHSDSSIRSCSTAKSLSKSLRGIILKSETIITQKIEMDSNSKKRIEALATRLKVEATKCFDLTKIDFYKILRKHTGTDFKSIIDYFNENEEEFDKLPEETKNNFSLISSDLNPFIKVIELYGSFTSNMYREIDSLQIPIEKINYLSTEDEADILAQIILNRMDRNHSYSTMMLRHFNDVEKSTCYNVISNGNKPYQGYLKDDHHSHCWRYWRSTKLQEELEIKENEDFLIQKLLKVNSINPVISQ